MMAYVKQKIFHDISRMQWRVTNIQMQVAKVIFEFVILFFMKIAIV